MSTEAKEVKTTINRNAVTAIAGALERGLREVNATGNFLTTVCKIARQHYKGKAIPKGDLVATLETLADDQAWTKGTRAVRQSEYKAVLLAYDRLEETMAAFKSRSGRCSWHDGIALARLLRSNAPNAAAKQHATRKPKGTTEPGKLARSEAKGVAATLIKRMLKFTKIEAAFRDALRELAGEYSIKV